jgi:hypothetical protein
MHTVRTILSENQHEVLLLAQRDGSADFAALTSTNARILNLTKINDLARYKKRFVLQLYAHELCGCPEQSAKMTKT